MEYAQNFFHSHFWVEKWPVQLISTKTLTHFNFYFDFRLIFNTVTDWIVLVHYLLNKYAFKPFYYKYFTDFATFHLSSLIFFNLWNTRRSEHKIQTGAKQVLRN